MSGIIGPDGRPVTSSSNGDGVAHTSMLIQVDKLEPISGDDVLLIRPVEPMPQHIVQQLMQTISQHFIHKAMREHPLATDLRAHVPLIIVMAPGDEVGRLDKQAMRQFGWQRVRDGETEPET